MNSMTKTIELEIKNKSAWVKFHDPKGLNTMGFDFFEQLEAILDKIQKDETLRCVVFSSTARNFSVGLDFKEAAGRSPEELHKIGMKADIFKKIGELTVPTLALYRGFTIGGGVEMTIACDFRFAQADTKISIPGVKIGIFNPAMLTYYLPRMIGLARASSLLLDAEVIDAEQALSWGLVNKIGNGETELLKEAEEWCKRMEAYDTVGLKSNKKLLRQAFDLSYEKFEFLEEKEIELCFKRNEPIELMKNFWK